MKFKTAVLTIGLLVGLAAVATANPMDDRPLFRFLITAVIYEPAVVLVETVAYVWILRLSLFRALLIAALANLVSLVVGFQLGFGLGATTFPAALARHLSLAWIVEVPILILLTLDQPGKNPLPDFAHKAVWTGIGVNAVTNTIGLILLAILR